MRSKALLIALAAVLLLAAASPLKSKEPVAEPSASPEKTLAQMGWLAGTWSGDLWGGTFVAYYSTPEGGRVLSHSRLMKDGREAFYEFEVFEAREGVLRMQPYPGGKPAAGFSLTEHDADARKATFENPENDFPSRIVYHRVSDRNLVITLSAPHHESEKVQTFDLKR